MCLSMGAQNKSPHAEPLGDGGGCFPILRHTELQTAAPSHSLCWLLPHLYMPVPGWLGCRLPQHGGSAAHKDGEASLVWLFLCLHVPLPSWLRHRVPQCKSCLLARPTLRYPVPQAAPPYHMEPIQSIPGPAGWPLCPLPAPGLLQPGSMWCA